MVAKTKPKGNQQNTLQYRCSTLEKELAPCFGLDQERQRGTHHPSALSKAQSGCHRKASPKSMTSERVRTGINPWEANLNRPHFTNLRLVLKPIIPYYNPMNNPCETRYELVTQVGEKSNGTVPILASCLLCITCRAHLEPSQPTRCIATQYKENPKAHVFFPHYLLKPCFWNIKLHGCLAKISSKLSATALLPWPDLDTPFFL